MKLKFFRWIAIILIATASLSSCTILQYRASVKTIKTQYQKRGIATDFAYFKVDSLDRTLRIQKVEKEGNTISIVFIHGSPSSSLAWMVFMPDSTLIKAANLYAVDRPGYGYSDFGKSMASIQLQSFLISEFLKEIKIRNIILIGSSYGGPIAARIAVLNTNVDGVMMISAAIDPAIENDIWASRFTQWNLTRWIVPTGYRVAGDEKSVHAAELKKLEKDWSQVNVPVYHLHGDADNIVPVENLKYTDSVFTKVETKIFPNAGHELAWRHPQMIKDEIISFLNTIYNSNQ